MRLWHYELIGVLPRKQLIAQWRECCCIVRNVAKNGTPNHLLVNKILLYPCDNFLNYCEMVIDEMENRKYNVSEKSKDKLFLDIHNSRYLFDNKTYKSGMFKYWHNERYLKQCFYNLQEKFDCNGFKYDEYEKIMERMVDLGQSDIFRN